MMRLLAGDPYRQADEEAVMVERSTGPRSPGPASPDPPADAPAGGRLSGGLIATLAGGGLLGLFIGQNTQDVTLQFLFWSFTWPLWLFTIVVAVLGALLWIGVGVLRRHRRRAARRAARDV